MESNIEKKKCNSESDMGRTNYSIEEIFEFLENEFNVIREKETKSILKKDFIINGYEKLDTMSRTVTIDKNTFLLLDKFSELVPAYAKQNILNKIILEGLETYIDLEDLEDGRIDI